MTFHLLRTTEALLALFGLKEVAQEVVWVADSATGFQEIRVIEMHQKRLYTLKNNKTTYTAVFHTTWGITYSGGKS